MEPTAHKEAEAGGQGWLLASPVILAGRHAEDFKARRGSDQQLVLEGGK